MTKKKIIKFEDLFEKKDKELFDQFARKHKAISKRIGELIKWDLRLEEKPKIRYEEDESGKTTIYQYPSKPVKCEFCQERDIVYYVEVVTPSRLDVSSSEVKELDERILPYHLCKECYLRFIRENPKIRIKKVC